MRARRLPCTSLLALLALLAACGGEQPGRAVADRQTWRMLASEGLVLAWQREQRLRPLEESLLDLRLPGPGSLALFAEEVEVLPLAREPAAEVDRLAAGAIRRRTWPAATEAPARIPTGDLAPLAPLLEQVAWFEEVHVKIHLPPPAWLDEGLTRWRCNLLVGGRARLRDGRLGWIRARQELDWERPPGDRPDLPAADWRIVAWRCTGAELVTAPGILFSEVVDAVVPDPELRDRIRRSLHEEEVLEFLRDPAGFRMPHPLWRPEAGDRHPGLAVADVDGDGLEDLYLMPRKGRNILLRARPDGTFEEAAARFGLDVDGHCSAAVFADFDNDGDTDLLLGRTLAHSAYYENRGGLFEARLDATDAPLPGLVSSISVADADGDGLLDAYLCTYAGDTVQRAMLALRARRDRQDYANALEPWLEPGDWERLRAEMQAAARDDRFYTAEPGPPNVLLRNLGGGRFAPDGGGALRIFRNSYHAAWADYDNDGDPDLYCANDFSANNLFRNDGEAGFTDVTVETGTADIGFGMGAHWADWNGDGRLDLHVTNMFSKAGRRVTSFFTEGESNFAGSGLARGISPVFRRMAGGNSLFTNLGGRFEKVSGLSAPAVPVEEGGWGWGSQFLDLDMDGRPDLYSLSGYYSAPGEAAIAVDL